MGFQRWLPDGCSRFCSRSWKHLGIPVQNSIALGDYNNDIEMLKAAGVGIAVENATDAAKAAADIVTVSNDEHAVARVIYGIENGTIKVF